jgi:hypothetical protein
MNDALGYDLTDKHTTVASYGGVGSQTGGASRSWWEIT